jgi:predicted O-linked N-acetylglucosamine transferase (SPINDLY family)
LLAQYPRGEILHNLVGALLAGLGQADRALVHYDTAIALAGDYVEAHNNRGALLMDQGRLQDALASFDTAVRLKPDYADAFFNRGNVLKLLQRPADALASYDKAIALAPGLAVAHNNRGVVLRALKRPADALASHQRALALRPDYALAYAETLDLQAHLCLWPQGARDDALLDAAVGNEAIPPFYMLNLADDPARQLGCARRWATAKFGFIRAEPVPVPSPAPRIRIGYFSADFHDHATMYLMARMFELHDKSRFEIHAFSYGGDAEDAMRRRLVKAVDHFHDVAALDDRAIAQRARALGVDIAVDLKGYTENGRPAIFAHRAAPVQVSYLGYPGTLGTDFIDYLIADPIVVPADRQAFFSERILSLPNSYQVNDNLRAISDKPVTRADVGLPEQGFVFCCFNNSYKITPREMDIWMRLLGRVEGSVLWLLRPNAAVERNLRREAERRGVDPARLVFADKIALPDHLARHRCADLFLDTFNVNAHTTASDALWAGLPLVTRLGDSFVARVAGSLLHAIGMPELVAETAEDYEALALALAVDPARLAALKARLVRNRLTTPLFDTERTVRDIESLYQSIAHRNPAEQTNAIAA